MVYANQTKVNSITSRKGLYVKTTVLVKRLYIIIFVEEIIDSCIFVVVFHKIMMYMYMRLVNASIFFQRHVMTIIIAKMREKSVEQTLLANKIAMEDEH